MLSYQLLMNRVLSFNQRQYQQIAIATASLLCKQTKNGKFSSYCLTDEKKSHAHSSSSFFCIKIHIIHISMYIFEIHPYSPLKFIEISPLIFIGIPVSFVSTIEGDNSGRKFQSYLLFSLGK